MEAVMGVFSLRLAAGLVAPVLGLAMTLPALSADIIYERQAEYERYSEPAPVYRAPVYAPPAYVVRPHAGPPPYAPYPYSRYERVYRPPAPVPYAAYPGYVQVDPQPPVYAAPRQTWSVPPQELAEEEEVVEAAPPYGWRPERRPRW
jgi:hypothetical protein